MRDYKFLSEFLKNHNYTLTNEQKEMFDKYYEILIETNKVMNLTAITDFSDVEEKHFIDSAALISCFDLNKVDSLIDMGTGAGFPGLPLKILFPHLNVVLADSLNKRVNFLNSVIKELGLRDITAIHGRAEEIGKNKDYREKFDICVSRAVARMSVLAEYCIPLVKVDGYFIPFKAGNSSEEIEEGKRAVEVLGGKIEKVENITIGPSKLLRTFPVIKKIKNTSAKYPRKAGVPAKDPIL